MVLILGISDYAIHDQAGLGDALCDAFLNQTCAQPHYQCESAKPGAPQHLPARRLGSLPGLSVGPRSLVQDTHPDKLDEDEGILREGN